MWILSKERDSGEALVQLDSLEKLLAISKKDLFLPGFEPGTFCVWGKCDTHFTTETRLWAKTDVYLKSHPPGIDVAARWENCNMSGCSINAGIIVARMLCVLNLWWYGKRNSAVFESVGRDSRWFRKSLISSSGNRTPVFHVTGGDTVHYTNEDCCTANWTRNQIS